MQLFNYLFVATVFIYISSLTINVLCDPDASSRSVENNYESSTYGKRIELLDRGNTKFLLPASTVKNKKYQVTSPVPPKSRSGQS